MIPLFTQEEFNKAKDKDYLSCECLICKKEFQKTKKRIKQFLKPDVKEKGDFCSRTCSNLNRKNLKLKYNVQEKPKKECLFCNKEFYINTNQKFCSRTCLRNSKPKTLIDVECKNCKTKFKKDLSNVNRSNNHFCSRSCSASYNNKNKTKGNRRSKLEIWLEEQLTNQYPNLLIDFNKKSAIGSELDIYIPSLNVAFELNGLFHYEPIFGVNKLNQIRENDKNKFQKCFENKIDLCIIDTSKQIYVKPSTSQKYLDIITNIINERLN